MAYNIPNSMNYGQQQLNTAPSLLPQTSGFSPLAVPGNATQAPVSWWDRAFGNESADGMKTNGFAMPAIQGMTSLANLFMGMKQYGLAKDGFDQSKREFNMNYDASKRTTNADLEDRQRARVSSNPGAYQSVGSYMLQNGVR